LHFSELFIRRPVFASVVSILMVLIGIVSYDTLTVREYPAIDEPVVNVTTTYRGASAKVIEREVTNPIEEAMAGIEGIEVLSSTSRAEQSLVTARFTLATDPDVAASDVRDRVGRARGNLPQDVDEPIIAKVEADATPIMYIPVRSDRYSALEITDYLDRVVKDQLQTLPGVAEVRIFGARLYSMRVWIDRNRLAAHDLTVQDVENAIRQQNTEIPSGRIESHDREFTVLADTGLNTPEEFSKIIVKQAGSYQVQLGEIAHVEVAPEDERRAATYNGQTSVTLGIVRQATANPIDVSRAVRADLERMAPSFPDGITHYVAFDQAIFIEESIASVYETIGEAVALVVVVIFLFLRTVRASVIPIVTIPISLITTFALMNAMGFSINTLTLLAMVLAIGLVVDDAIVVLENIYRHIEDGMQPFAAAIAGAKQIAFAVIAMTLTLVAVYAPIGFATGRTGKLFQEFAFTLAGAVLVSGFVALTLTPMLCSKLLRHETSPNLLQRGLESGLRGIERAYSAVLKGALAFRWLVLGIAVIVAALSYGMFITLPSELAPTEDRGTLLIVGRAPEGATLEYNRRYAKMVEQVVSEVPEVAGYLVVSGFPQVTNLISFNTLKPWDDRERSQQEIVKGVQNKLSDITGILAFAINPASLGQSGRSQPIQFVIQSSGSYADLEEKTNKLLDAVRQNPGFINVDTDLKLTKPQLDIDVDRSKATDAGVDIATIGRTLESLLGGRRVTRYEQGGEQYEVIVQVADSDRQTPTDISNIFVRVRDGSMVQLSNYASVREVITPDSLNHFNQLRSATITANLDEGFSMGEALAFLRQTVDTELPQGTQTALDGQLLEFVKASGTLGATFILALAFIYLVLSAQFESFIDPLIIMVSVPLSMAGALFALHATGTTLNIYSQVGLVTLIGLITKHGILIVEFANQERAKGLEVYDAVLRAAQLRLRPILMTTGAMVLGAVPLALAAGAGAESRQAIGWVIVGGVSVGTVLTLFVVPSLYYVVGMTRERFRRAPVAQPAE